ncbi:MAG TPA: M20/M25/M40 family metallo-hydrolase [Terriglobales bacterium]|nr:M20/M25/M40 family metallo-hydrolase [Terriglobales bacterium]
MRLNTLRNFLVVALLCAASLSAQTAPEASPKLTAEMKRIQQAALQSDYSYQFAAHLTDNIGPRLSGSVQYNHAAQWVAAEFKRLGLEVKLEKVMVPHWVRGEERAELVQFPGMTPNTTQKIVLTALGASVATPANGITAEVIAVNNFDELAALGREKVQGKIVVFNHKFDQRMAEIGDARDAYGLAVEYRSKAPTEAGKLGAVASLISSVGGADFRLPHTGNTRYAKDVPKIPAGALAAEDAELIARLVKQGTVRMHLVMTPQTLPDAEAYNVIGDLKGSEHPEQVVIVSGHLDSWDLGTGAIDDAAGVAHAVDAVRVIKELGLRPRRTIRVIAWANEENGLRGGLGYAIAHKDEIANHQAAIESDMGAGHPTGLLFAGDPAIEKMLEPASKVLRGSGAGIVRATDQGGADTIPVGALGVPTFEPLQDVRTYFHYHHTAADTLDKIEPQAQRENTAVLGVLAYFLANIDQQLPRSVKPLPEWLKQAMSEAVKK